jgi:deoxyribonuclease-4
MLLGAHVPTKGGLANAPAHGRAIGATAIQIFTRNQMQWNAKPLGADEVAAFKQALGASGIRIVLSHGSYLVNLASPDPLIAGKSRDAFLEEMQRCGALGIPYLIFHPGAHMGAGPEAGVGALAASLDHVLEKARDLEVMPLLEVTAGQGSYLGSSFEQLRAIIDRVRRPERLGVCLDTCHLLAAGYDIATQKGYERTLADCERILGLERVKALHLNDSKKGLGSHLDRHERIGKGCLGVEAFRRIVNDRRLAHVPMVLETPDPLAAWKKEIALLRRLAG